MNSTEKKVTFGSDKRDCSLVTVTGGGRKKCEALNLTHTYIHTHTGLQQIQEDAYVEYSEAGSCVCGFTL